MAVSIPYDPSLVLGELVSSPKLKSLVELGDVLVPLRDAEERYNDLLRAKISLDSSLKEAEALGIKISDETEDKKKELDDSILNALNAVVEEKVKAYGDDGTVQKAKQDDDGIINFAYNSPVDFTRTQIKSMPISSNSINLDSQYFSFGTTTQSSRNALKQLKGFVSSAFSFLGNKISTEMSAAAVSSASHQQENHKLLGTLVITASATHQDARVLQPLVLNPDETVQVYNRMYPEDKLPRSSQREMQQILLEAETQGAGSDSNSDNTVNILSGVTLGSSFVGMVHILNNESTTASQTNQSVTEKMETTMKRGAWFNSMSGGFGVEGTFANDVKELLSTHEISSHCTIVSNGCIPSIKSNQVQLGVKQFADFDPQSMGEKLATLANSTASDVESLDSAARAARTGQQMVSLRSGEISSVMSGLEKVDQGANMILDVNSLMTAFEDYANKASTGDAGVPINFYVREFNKVDIARDWLAHYYPDGVTASSAGSVTL